MRTKFTEEQLTPGTKLYMEDGFMLNVPNEAEVLWILPNLPGGVRNGDIQVVVKFLGLMGRVELVRVNNENRVIALDLKDFWNKIVSRNEVKVVELLKEVSHHETLVTAAKHLASKVGKKFKVKYAGRYLIETPYWTEGKWTDKTEEATVFTDTFYFVTNYPNFQLEYLELENEA